MKRLLPIAFVLSTAIANLAWADYAPTARPFQYTKNPAHASPDALSPLETQVLKQIAPEERVDYQPENANGKLLTMIVKRDGQYVAFIGKKAIHVGDRLGQMTVTHISQTEMMLDDGQNTVALSLEGPARYSHTHSHLSHDLHHAAKKHG